MQLKMCSTRERMLVLGELNSLELPLNGLRLFFTRSSD